MTLAAIAIGPAFLIVGLASLVFFIVTIVDMARRPGWLWTQAGSSKGLWVALEIVCFVLLGFLSIVVGILYYVVIRPRLLTVVSQRGGPPDSWPPQTPGYGEAPPAPWSPYPPPGETPAYPPPRDPSAEGAAEPGAAPPPYPGGGPPPAPGSTPVAPYPGSASVPPYPGSPAGYPPAAGYSAQPTSNPPFGWYPDPSGRHEQRYWDGTRWTGYVTDNGQQSTDPVPG